MDVQENRTLEGDTVEFLLAEYQTLRELRANLVGQAHDRVKFFLTFGSIVAAVLALASQLRGTTELFYVVVLVTLLVLFLAGTHTFGRLIEAHISITVYTRGMNKVRRYFAERDPHIEDYLILPIYDDEPEFGAIGFVSTKLVNVGLTAMIILMNGLLGGVLSGTLVGVATDVPVATAALMGVIIAVVTIIGHRLYYDRRIRDAKSRRDEDVRFPRP